MNSEEIVVKEKILSFKIDGEWSIVDFNHFFEDLNTLYRLLIEIDNIDFIDYQLSNKKSRIPLTENFIRINDHYYRRVFESYSILTPSLRYKKPTYNSFRIISSQFNLNVKEIKFASPGFTDFSGIGKVIDSLFELIKYYIPNAESKIRKEILKEDLLSKRIENLKSMGYSNVDIQKYEALTEISLINIMELRHMQKIKSVHLDKTSD